MDSIETINEADVTDIEEAVALVWNVFLEFEAPDYCEEGIHEFEKFIEHDAIKEKVLQSQLKMWVCKKNGIIVGVLAARPPCHISLLFVDKAHHRKGIARFLLNEMIKFYKTDASRSEITVNSSPYALEAYHRLGFHDTSSEQTVNGIRFIPMKRQL